MSDLPPSPDEPFILPRKGYFWGFTYLRPRCEKKFARRLADLGVRSYLPLMKKARVHNRGKVISWIPMFPGYVFLEIPNILYTDILRIRDVLKLTLPEERAVQEQLIADLNRVRKCEIVAEGRKVVVNPGIQPGMTVMVKSGALAGQEVVVSRRLNEVYVVVNLKFLGQSCEWKINAGELDEIT